MKPDNKTIAIGALGVISVVALLIVPDPTAIVAGSIGAIAGLITGDAVK